MVLSPAWPWRRLNICDLLILPNALDRVQIWRIARQTDDLDLARRTLCQKGFDFTIMDRGAIPDQKQLAANLVAQMPHKAYDVSTGEGAILAAQVQLARRGQRTNHRALLARQRLTQNGCLANRGIGAHGRWQQIEAGLIDEDQRAPLGYGSPQRLGNLANSLTTTSSVVAALNSVLAGSLASDLGTLVGLALTPTLAIGAGVSLVLAVLHIWYAARYRRRHMQATKSST